MLQILLPERTLKQEITTSRFGNALKTDTNPHVNLPFNRITIITDTVYNTKTDTVFLFNRSYRIKSIDRFH
ncbi:hypothetical protein M0802_003241 [Mischocyttarus mexicanus]|nr:hypothetical protein M0802_003241 [Mischocyttarus mexicanus]